MLLRILCLILVTALQAGADNKVLGQPLDNFGAIIFGGALLSDKYAKIAREIVHNANYTVLGTIATTKPLKGYPMVDILPFADSKRNESSTGDINFLLQKNNPVFANIKKKNAVSATFSNETQSFNNETLTLESAGYKVIITGYVAQIPMNATDANSTIEAITSRHPYAAAIATRLNTLLCKIEIEQICVIDETIGPFYVAVDEYYNADVDE